MKQKKIMICENCSFLYNCKDDDGRWSVCNNQATRDLGISGVNPRNFGCINFEQS